MAPQAPLQADTGGDQWVTIPDWQVLEPGAELDFESEFVKCFVSDAPETIGIAWAMVMGDESLPADVERAAVDELVVGGAQGVAWQVVIPETHPFVAIGVVLERNNDPRADLFLAELARISEADEVICEFDGRALPAPQMLKVIHRKCQRLRASARHGRVPTVRPRSRRWRCRRRTRAPPSGDGDDEPPDESDLDPPCQDAAA